MREPKYRKEGIGRISREKEVSFLFDHTIIKGFEGDTVASALLSYGKRIVGRSFKYHRPRGIMGFGSEEPNALVSYGINTSPNTPNTRATMLEIAAGMEVQSQHAWPSVDYDLGQITSLFGRFLPAGFYYKTFIHGWKFYEPLIRRMAGLGKANEEICEKNYHFRYFHCDVLIIGGGLAGLSALAALMDKNLRIAIVDENLAPGGWLLGDEVFIDGVEGASWAKNVWETAQKSEKVKCLSRTTAVAMYQQNFVLAAERKSEALGSELTPREILWKIRAKEVILASGAIEQPSAFVGNDLPGVMMAGAVRRYLRHYGVCAGDSVGVVTNNDSAYETAIALEEAGSSVQVIDSRQNPRGIFADKARDKGLDIVEGHYIWQAKGWRQLSGVVLQRLLEGGASVRTPSNGEGMEILAMSHGFTPSIHLYCHQGGKLVFDEEKQVFVPKNPQSKGLQVVGMARGIEGAWAVAQDAKNAVLEVFKRLKIQKPMKKTDQKFSIHTQVLNASVDSDTHCEKIWIPNLAENPQKQFIDFQNDVTAKDVILAHQEGFRSVEHLKRYTTLGMATDQGKSSNMQGLVLMSRLRMEDVQDVGTTKYRPPYTPATIGTFAGLNRYDQFEVIRTTAAHKLQVLAGAVFEDVGNWKRARYYPENGESMDSAVMREAKQTRLSVGMMDASTLGKIDIRGKDAVKLLEMVYCNNWQSLSVGRCRYGLMLNEEGMVMDDGVTTCLGEGHYHMTTTTGGALRVLNWLELWLQTEWPDFDVFCTSVTEEWSVYSLNGPRSRELLEQFVDIDLSDEAFPMMHAKDCTFMGIPARIFRVSFTGESTAFEVNVPSLYGLQVWQALCEAGKACDMVVYGTETMHLLRAEAGFVIVGQDTDGMVNPHDLGYGGMVSKKKSDFLGKKGLMLEGSQDKNRRHLVGLIAEDGKERLEEGAAIVEGVNSGDIAQIGHVTSSYNSPNLGKPIAMGLVSGGFDKMGEWVSVARRTEDNEQEFLRAKIVSKEWMKEKQT